MRSYIILVGLFSCIIGCFCDSKDENHTDYEHLLVDMLTKHYRIGGRPVKSNKEPVIVYYDLKINKLEKLVTLNQVLITHTFAMIKWFDPHLTWKEEDYNGTDVITLPQTSIWTPDIMLYNTADDTNKAPKDMYKAPVNVFSNGTVVWYVPVVWKSSCMVDITWFPVDTQVCELIFASLSYTKSRLLLRFHQQPANLQDSHGEHHITNGEWNFLSLKASYRETHYDCCKEHVSQIIYELRIKRRPLFFMLYMIIPVCAIVFLSLLTFVIPPDSGERVGFGVTILLTMGVYLMVISEDLPKTAHKAPLIGVLYVTLFYIMTLAYVVSTVNVSLIGRTTRPPRFLSKLVRRRKDTRDWTSHNGSIRLRNRGNSRASNIDRKTSWQAVESNIDEEQSCRNSKKESIVRRLSLCESDGEKEQRNNIKWRKISSLLDKLFFWVFLIMIIIATAVVLLVLELKFK